MVDDTSFYIQLKPTVDENYEWTGDLEVNIVTDKENPIDKNSFMSMMHLSEIVACSIAYMEENPDLISCIEDFMDSAEFESVKNNSKPQVEYTDGNVVRLTFGSRTKGNA